MCDSQSKTELTSRELVCIACPVGCRVEVKYAEGGCGIVTLIGNKCKRGEAYAQQEVLDPSRTVTAVVETDSKILPYIPVRTNKPLPMQLIDKLLEKIYYMRIEGPLKLGHVIVDDFAGTGVNVVLTRTLPE